MVCKKCGNQLKTEGSRCKACYFQLAGVIIALITLFTVTIFLLFNVIAIIATLVFLVLGARGNKNNQLVTTGIVTVCVSVLLTIFYFLISFFIHPFYLLYTHIPQWLWIFMLEHKLFYIVFFVFHVIIVVGILCILRVLEGKLVSKSEKHIFF